MNDPLEHICALYARGSKHGQYQILPRRLQALLSEEEKEKIKTRSRYEKQRLDYILEKIDIKGKTFCDIGCNTGYFSFEFLERGAKSAALYEGNPAHAEFCLLAAELLGYKSNVTVHNVYYSFGAEAGADAEHYDVCLLLNVLYHVGDDYGTVSDAESAKANILSALKELTTLADTLILQIGFNWMGDPRHGLFSQGTKGEMIAWLQDGIKGYWRIRAAGIAEKDAAGRIGYHDINERNQQRMDLMGEFLNRPLFILEKQS